MPKLTMEKVGCVTSDLSGRMTVDQCYRIDEIAGKYAMLSPMLDDASDASVGGGRSFSGSSAAVALQRLPPRPASWASGSGWACASWRSWMATRRRSQRKRSGFSPAGGRSQAGHGYGPHVVARFGVADRSP